MLTGDYGSSLLVIFIIFALSFSFKKTLIVVSNGNSPLLSLFKVVSTNLELPYALSVCKKIRLRGQRGKDWLGVYQNVLSRVFHFGVSSSFHNSASRCLLHHLKCSPSPPSLTISLEKSLEIALRKEWTICKRFVTIS